MVCPQFCGNGDRWGFHSCDGGKGGSEWFAVACRPGRRPGALVAAIGPAGAVTAIVEPTRARLEIVETVLGSGATHLASGATMLLGLTLVFVGRGVARRHRLAWGAAIILLVAAAVALLAMGPNVEAATSLAVCGALVQWAPLQDHLYTLRVTSSRSCGSASIWGLETTAGASA